MMCSRSLSTDETARALRRSQERLQSILDSAYNAYVAIDEQGLVIDWNRQAVATFGYSREEALGRAISDLIIPERLRAAHWAGLRQFLATGKGPVLNQRVEIDALHRQGHEIPVELTIWPLRGDAGWTFHAFILDATEIRAAQRQAMLAERQAAAGQLIKLITRESDNPLQQLQTWSEMLALSVPKNPTASRALGEIQRALVRLERLFIDVHGYAAPLQLTPRTVQLAELWRETWRQLVHLKQCAGSNLQEDIGCADLRCTADPDALGQALHHLLEHALDRTADGKSICVACHDDALDGAPALRLTFRSRGPPLSCEERDLVDAALSPDDRARGLDWDTTYFGLTIAARIIAAHGGCLEVGNDDRPGGEMRMFLPRQA